MMPGEPFVQKLMRAAPELAPLHRKHLEENYGDVLPHVLLGQITFFLAEQAAANPNHPLLPKVIGFLEGELARGAPDSRELIVGSFVENLLGEPAAIRALSHFMGPALTRAVEEICLQPPPPDRR